MNEGSAYKFIGKDGLTGGNMYLVPVRENRGKKKQTSLEDGLFDDLPEDYYFDCNLELPRQKERDANNLTLSDFQEMELKEIYFHIYQQLKSISLLLSDNREV